MQSVASGAVYNALQGYTRFIHYTNNGESRSIKFTVSGNDATLLVSANTPYGKACLFFIRARHSAVGDSSRIVQNIFGIDCYVQVLDDTSYWINAGQSSNGYLLADILVLNGDVSSITNYNP